ncbi:MAG: stage III sporulation protein AG [Lachnospiraceae bacterium]|nr:stage III sporulation protein AG [Lachnospiraceae bacterium]
MERLNKLINKITGGRKLRKDQLLIMVLSGILLCIIALPVNSNDSKQKTSSKKSDITDNGSDIVEKNTQRQDTLSTTSYPNEDYDLSYTGYWEEKLEQSLACIEGAGDVDVLITLKESETRILEKDIPIEVNETAEEDAEGGKRTIREVQQESVTVYTVNEEGQNVPYVSKIIQPVVEGVVVIAQGGDSAVVKENIIETIQVLFGIDANKIRVVKGKSKY